MCAVGGSTALDSQNNFLNLFIYLFLAVMYLGASQVVLVVENPPANVGDISMLVQSLDQEDPLEEGMATHSSILA